MDFTFSPEQEALRDAVRSFVEREGGRQLVRQAVEDSGRLPEAIWQRMADLGWAGLLIPADLGGLGLGLVDLVVVQEELGKFAFPGPFVSSAVQATVAARHLGATDLLESLAAGTTRGTLAVEELGVTEPLSPSLATIADPGGALHGVKSTVLDGDTADWALVVARDDSGLGCYVVDHPAAEVVPGLDVTRRLTRLSLEGREARRVGPAGDQTELLQRIVDDIAVALCAETVGACDAALAMAVEYSKTRVQFDRIEKTCDAQS